MLEESAMVYCFKLVSLIVTRMLASSKRANTRALELREEAVRGEYEKMVKDPCEPVTATV